MSPRESAAGTMSAGQRKEAARKLKTWNLIDLVTKGESVDAKGEVVWNFEGAAGQLESGLTMATLRLDQEKYRIYEQGDIIIANCPYDQKKVPLVVIDSKSGTTPELFLPLLALDGFLTHEQAIARLAEFYPGFNDATPARLLIVTTIDRFTRFTLGQRQRLLTQPAEISVADPKLRDVFFPSLAEWLADRQGSAHYWFGFLTDYKLAPEKTINETLIYLEHRYPKLMRFVMQSFRGFYMVTELQKNWAFPSMSRAESLDFYHHLILLKKPKIDRNASH